MKPRISLITLGVADLERSLHFYRDGLGRSLPVKFADRRNNGQEEFSASPG
jgi:catechol 2,3-dioxygenase-like lactoylglutathione lyase family enzyme